LFPVTGPFPVTWQTLDMVLRPDFVCIEQIEFVTNRGRTSSFYDDRERPWLKRVALYTKTVMVRQVILASLHNQSHPR